MRHGVRHGLRHGLLQGLRHALRQGLRLGLWQGLSQRDVGTLGTIESWTHSRAGQSGSRQETVGVAGVRAGNPEAGVIRAARVWSGQTLKG